MIGIIDYGMGNLASVKNALNEVQQESIISSDVSTLRACEKLILPGVGAFGDCMSNIKQRSLDTFIRRQVASGKPLLGICLGMQMLFEESTEKGITKGFGFLKGRVMEIEDATVPVPEIGWNELVWNHESKLQGIVSTHPFVYYVHSYYAQAEDTDLVAYSTYGSIKVAGIVCRKNVLGTQFHPEKSGKDGLKILKYYAEEFE